jgi:hypothetical protein
LPPGRPEEFRTGLVLEHEFKFLLGDKLWDPKASALDPEGRCRTELLATAKQELGNQSKAATDDAERLATYVWSVRSLPSPGLSALCLSGGGIRSAAFSLGILQGLARRSVLDQFHYLSTVSGGGYIGSWLTAWRQRAAGGTDEVLDWLASRDKGWFAEPTELQRLRFNQNFLTPRVGLTSADTWATVAIVVRNLLLNWLVYLPLLTAILLTPHVFQAFVSWMGHHKGLYSSLVGIFADIGLFSRNPDAPALRDLPLLSYMDSLAVVFILFGFACSAYYRPSTNKVSMNQSWFVAVVVAPVVLGTMLLLGAVVSWLPFVDPMSTLPRWAFLGFLLFVCAPLLAQLALLVLGGRHASSPGERLLEGVGWAVAGLLTGLLIGIGAVLLNNLLVQADPHPLAECQRRYPAIWYEAYYQSVARLQLLKECGGFDVFNWITVCGLPWVVLSFLCGETLYVGVTSKLSSAERNREWLARASGNFGAVACVYFIFSWLVIFGWPAIVSRVNTLAVGSGLLSILGALLPVTRATANSVTKERLPITSIITVFSGIFVVTASAALASATFKLVHWAGLNFNNFVVGVSQALESVARSFGLDRNNTIATWIVELASAGHNFVHWVSVDLNNFSRPDWLSRELDPTFIGSDPMVMFAPLPELLFLTATAALLVAFSVVLSLFVNVNWFSLHALYRNRLVKTFLGASNVKEDGKREKFDGYSDFDNMPISALQLTIANEKASKGQACLYPVINMTLNVVASSNLAWQQRKAEPFICTPWVMGGDRVGYRLSAEFGSSNSAFPRGTTLGTAMAISGAAASPNWGYHSSPITSLLMMLANVRLGWWMGNPRQRRFSRPWCKVSPGASWLVFLQEALGLTDDRTKWIYLSDGGHFENLGLYEMVRRRCRSIVVVDAGADPDCTLEDLGNAVRKIAIDLRVKLEFRRIDLRRRSPIAMAGAYFAIGEVMYPEGCPGKILYIKPGFYGKQEPADIRAYAAANAKFPHESTLNQWFGESQFESYRSLGSFVVDEICGSDGGQFDLASFFKAAKKRLDDFEETLPDDGSTLMEIRKPIAIKRRSA